jgi:hypothetical protein
MIKQQELPVDEVLQMIKRIHVPGYEHARFYFDQAMSEGAFEPNMPKDYYSRYDIQATLQFIKKSKK